MNIKEDFKKKDEYSDGDVENELLSLFKSTDVENKILEILNNNPNWPTRYHLSPIRENLLNWYDFNPQASLLEIGAGCGALTGLFCKKLKKVTAIELSERRADIIRHRNKDKKNLTINVGNLNDMESEEKFDYITLIGVLEYAGRFTHTKNPFIDFLKNVRKSLKDDGTLIIAIENKFGLKYWAGVREDHTGKFFDSIENYNDQKEIQTFGNEELKTLLSNSGYGKIDFYYPMPDYKLPIEIFSDEYLPTEDHNIRLGMFPVQDFSNSREFLLNEKLVMDNIIKNKQFSFFANSFLIFVRPL